ncbi:hypothetical protein BDF14DRAFT_1993873 [Spinellus fusiger]|nr:hypothetical protein BDF14DRAFT_1993873 [Spinellus fusiger]
MDATFPRVALVEAFLADSYVRSGWIAWTILFVLCGASWVVRSGFNDVAVHPTTVNPAVTGNTESIHNYADTEMSQHEKSPIIALDSTVYARIERAYRLASEMLTLLGSSLILNTFARGSTRAVMILSWVFTVIALVYYVLEVSFTHCYIRLGFTSILFAIAMAIIGLAYQQGFGP